MRRAWSSRARASECRLLHKKKALVIDKELDGKFSTWTDSVLSSRLSLGQTQRPQRRRRDARVHRAHHARSKGQ